MARIVPDSPFRRGYRKDKYGPSEMQKNLGKFASPQGIASSIKSADTIGGVLSATIMKKNRRDQLQSGIDEAKELAQLAHEARVQGPERRAKTELLQKRLNASGARDDRGRLLLVDGDFGANTQAALDNLQKQQAGLLYGDSNKGSMFNEMARAERDSGSLGERLGGRFRSMLGRETKEDVVRQAAARRAQQLQDDVFRARSTQQAYRAASGADLPSLRRGATQQAFAAYDRRIAPTITGQIAGLGGKATTEDLKRLFPGRRPQPRQQRSGFGGRPPMPKDPMPLLKNVQGNQTYQFITKAAALKQNPDLLNSMFDVAPGEGDQEGYLMDKPTADELRQLNERDLDPALRRAINENRRARAVRIVNLATDPNIVMAAQRAQGVVNSLTNAVALSRTQNVNDPRLQQSLANPDISAFVSGDSPEATLSNLANTQDRASAYYRGVPGASISNVMPSQKTLQRQLENFSTNQSGSQQSAGPSLPPAPKPEDAVERASDTVDRGGIANQAAQIEQMLNREEGLRRQPSVEDYSQYFRSQDRLVGPAPAAPVPQPAPAPAPAPDPLPPLPTTGPMVSQPPPVQPAEAFSTAPVPLVSEAPMSTVPPPPAPAPAPATNRPAPRRQRRAAAAAQRRRRPTRQPVQRGREPEGPSNREIMNALAKLPANEFNIRTARRNKEKRKEISANIKKFKTYAKANGIQKALKKFGNR